MERTLTAVFDGSVFRPESPLSPDDLQPNGRYILHIVEADASDDADSNNAWSLLEKWAGTIEGPEDWSEEHDHYLYGTPKRVKERDE